MLPLGGHIFKVEKHSFMIMKTHILKEIGLTPGEIKAYLALLTIGPSSTGPIAKESGVSRSKLYGILDRLEKKGLVSHVEKNGVISFQPVEPGKIKDYLKQKEEDIKRLQRDVELFIPQLEAYYQRAASSQVVRVYQGLKGLATAHEHTYLKLNRGEEYVYIGIPRIQPSSHHLYWKRDHERRSKAGIRCRLLFNKDTDPSVLKDRNSRHGCDARYLPVTIKTPAYYAIYKDTVVIAIASENPIAIEIVNQDIADSFLAYFEAFWQHAKPFTG